MSKVKTFPFTNNMKRSSVLLESVHLVHINLYAISKKLTLVKPVCQIFHTN